MQAAPQLPHGWQAAFDSRYQRWYYVHAASGTSQWEHPVVEPNQGQQNRNQGQQKGQQQQPQQETDEQQPQVQQQQQQHELQAQIEQEQQQQQQQQQQQEEGDTVYQYHDPWGRLLGPFTVEQLRGWRAHLPMDLLLLSPAAAAAAAATAAAAGASKDIGGTATGAGGTAGAAGVDAAAAAADSDAAAHGTGDVAAADDDYHDNAGAAAGADESTAAGAASSSADAIGSIATSAAAAAPAEAGSSPPKAAAAAAAAHPVEACCTGDSLANSTRLYLADLLGDSQLLKHFLESQQQQQQQQQAEQQQQQPAVPHRAVAPPAPVWQAWVSQYTTAALNQPTAAAAPAAAADTDTVSASIAAPTAASAWYMQHQRQYQQQQQLGVLGGPFAGSKGSGSNSDVAQKQGSSFDKYAAAVLQGLPPEDEAVQLAHMAAVHGYSLSDVLQQHQQYGSSAGVGGNATSASGITVTADGVSALMVKDPRSGRLSVAAGSNGSSSGGAAELYGDMARWCDPASLERMLLKRRQQQQQQVVGRGGVGSGGAAKRTRS